MTNERRISPKGQPAVRGYTPSNLDGARFEKELLKQHPELNAYSFEFTRGEVLIKEGLVSEERLAFLVIEGTLAEGQTHFNEREGHRAITLFQVGMGGIAFVQCLAPPYAILPAFTSVIAETDGRGYYIAAEWFEKVSKADRLNILTGQIALRHQLLTSLIRLRAERVLDKDISEIATNMLRTNPENAVPVDSLKQAIVRRLRAGEEAEKRLANFDIFAAKEMEHALDELRAEKDAEIERLKTDLAASKEREKTAAEGSALAFQYLEEEQKRQAQSAAAGWKLLEREFAKIPGHRLSDELKSAMLGIDDDFTDTVIGADIGQAVENLFDEALDTPSMRPTPVVPEPATLRSAPPTRDLPSFVGDDDEREDTLVGVQSARQMLPAQKPLLTRKPSSALAALVMVPPSAPTRRGLTPPPQHSPRKMTPLGVKAPSAPPPPSREPMKIVAPPSRREESAPDIEFEEAGRQTQDWGFASNLGTAPKK